MTPIGISQIGDHHSKGKITHRTVAGTDSAVQITLAANAKSMLVFNYGTGIAYFGGSGVTTGAYAFWLTPKGTHDFGHVDSGFSTYFILSTTETCTIGVAEDA